VGGLQRDQALFMGLKPHHATTAEASIIGHVNKLEGLTAEGVTGIKDGDGLFR